ncbi:MAG: hypothetical protein NVSMB44_25030 [Ktedonobacteraceae bacterium]
MLCPLCHTQNRDNAKFCKGCGRTLPVELETAEQRSTGQYTDAGQARGATSPSMLASGEASRGPTSVPAQQTVTPGASEATPDDQGDQVLPGQYDDISTAPTQILTQQEMAAIHQRHWQQDLERERPATGDVADLPTTLNLSPSMPVGRDLADYPTIITAPMSELAHGSSTPPPATTMPDAATSEADAIMPLPGSGQAQPPAGSPPPATPGTEASAMSGTVHEENRNQQTHEASAEIIKKNASATNDEEDSVEQPTGPEASQEQVNTTQTTQAAQAAQGTQGAHDDSAQEQSAGAFPLLSVGTLAGGRYELTQIISDSAEEHVYAVTDHQGYQHCWNCGSEENAEGDEFCNDCGAELLNAPYILHEYPIAEKRGSDARVFQGTMVNTFVDQGHTYIVEQPQATQMAFPNGVHLLASCDSDAGTVRRSEPNEDSTLALFFERVHESISSPAGIFVVADGMGGHANGQGASRATIAVISERIVRELIMPPLSAEKAGEESKALDEESLLALLHGSIEDANTTLCQINQRDKSDMGSTLTGFMIVGDHAYIFNVGDSRTYMLRDEKLYQLTNDHSLVGQLVAGGLIEPDDVYTHPQRNQIFRSIGDKLNVQIDLFKQQVHPGDVLLSCSDGLWEMVRDPQITEILNHATDPQTACKQLIEAANVNGGEDNVSAVVVFVR